MPKLRSFKLCPFNGQQLISYTQSSLCDISLGVQMTQNIILTELNITVTGFKPKQAAAKMLCQVLRHYYKLLKTSFESMEIKYSIVETTKNSKQKQFHYCGKRIKLDNPVTVKIGDKGITYTHHCEVYKQPHEYNYDQAFDSDYKSSDIDD